MTGECRHCERDRKSHARGLCHTCYDAPAVRALYPTGTPARREWAGREVAELRRLLALRWTHARVAAALGRSRGSVRATVGRLGLCRFRRKPPRREWCVGVMVAAGESDREIGRKLGCSSKVASDYRTARGLPPAVSLSEAGRRGARKSFHNCGREWPFLKARGPGLVACARAGWPLGCTPGRARVLAALEAGPLSARAVAAVNGYTLWCARRHLMALRELGWVTGGGRGRPGVTWALAPDAAARRAAAVARTGRGPQ